MSENQSPYQAKKKPGPKPQFENAIPLQTQVELADWLLVCVQFPPNMRNSEILRQLVKERINETTP